MTKLPPKEGPNNTLPVPVVPPKQHLTAAEIRRRAQVKEQEMQERIRRMTAAELSPDLGFYLDTVNGGGTIKARRLG
ncbi:hypothetical protein HYV64_01290 [Candidatus Shapirobacteria bacterium]|nr:hypothetical protein [Candidatus Shapirobacteria bacterium]